MNEENMEAIETTETTEESTDILNEYLDTCDSVDVVTSDNSDVLTGIAIGAGVGVLATCVKFIIKRARKKKADTETEDEGGTFKKKMHETRVALKDIWKKRESDVLENVVVMDGTATEPKNN